MAAEVLCVGSVFFRRFISVLVAMRTLGCGFPQTHKIFNQIRYCYVVYLESNISYTKFPSLYVLRVTFRSLERLTLILLTWRVWWAPNNASKWQMGFNLAFKSYVYVPSRAQWRISWQNQNKWRRHAYVRLVTRLRAARPANRWHSTLAMW
jgi:hypothetical protein